MHNSYVQERLRFYELLIKIFAVFLLFGDNAASLRCYVCGPEESLNDCDKFNNLNENLYAKECPPDSLSCTSIRTEDSIRSMACDNQKINDCKFMNRTEYCYCIYELCNGNKSIKKSITISSIDVNDDEDLNEGSGYNQLFPSTTGSAITPRYSTIEPPNNGDCLHSTFIIIAASILLP